MLAIDIGMIDKDLVDWKAVIERVIYGEKVIISQSGRNLAILNPSENVMPKPKRQFGSLQNLGRIPDDIHWGDDEVIAMFDESANKAL